MDKKNNFLKQNKIYYFDKSEQDLSTENFRIQSFHSSQKL